MKWKINSVSTLDAPTAGTIVMSNFTISDTQDGLQGSVTYSVNLQPAELANFVPFTDITEDNVIAWTKEALGEQRVAAMEAEVQTIIDAQKVATPTQTPLPWIIVEAPAVEVPTEPTAPQA